MVNASAVYKNESQKTYNITEAKRNEYRKTSQRSRIAKRAAEQGLLRSIHPVNTPNLHPDTLMTQLPKNNFSSLSLFSGGGGLDLGFDRAGYIHRASYELLPVCGQTFNALSDYHIQMFEMNAADFGIPQIRKRIIFVGYERKRTSALTLFLMNAII